MRDKHMEFLPGQGVKWGWRGEQRLPIFLREQGDFISFLCVWLKLLIILLFTANIHLEKGNTNGQLLERFICDWNTSATVWKRHEFEIYKPNKIVFREPRKRIGREVRTESTCMWRPRRGKIDTVSNFVKLWRPSWTVSFFIYSWPIVKSKIQSTNLHWPCRRWTRLWHTWFSWRSYGRTSGWSSWRLGWWFCTLISAILQAKNFYPW